MRNRRIDPERRCLRFDEWPEPDQAAWHHALRKGSILNGYGPGANWSEPTQLNTEKIYGRWINFLERADELDPARPLAERVTPDRVVRFVEILRSQVRPFTVWSYLDRLCAALRVMAPETDWGWLRTLVNHLYRQKGPARSLTNRLVPPSRIISAGLKLMRDAEAASNIRPIWRATRYRDGLMLALLAARPLRIKNISDIAIGRHLVRIGNEIILIFEAAEMKNRRPFEVSVPEALLVWLEHYLTDIRPQLLAGKTSDALWITQYGVPMQCYSIHTRVTKLTRRLFGVSMSTHLFRHALATNIAINDPASVRMATAILGHSSFATTDRYYIMAQGLEASRAHGRMIDELRAESTGGIHNP